MSRIVESHSQRDKRSNTMATAILIFEQSAAAAITLESNMHVPRTRNNIAV